MKKLKGILLLMTFLMSTALYDNTKILYAESGPVSVSIRELGNMLKQQVIIHILLMGKVLFPMAMSRCGQISM